MLLKLAEVALILAETSYHIHHFAGYGLVQPVKEPSKRKEPAHQVKGTMRTLDPEDSRALTSDGLKLDATGLFKGPQDPYLSHLLKTDSGR